ncbi:carbohydrate ABC transporter permease [Paenibacillus sp. Root444D2]|uniref:carbohydrate ABC transporter permease n=1 Tax=Paenibacillus sp. Root444D2 TaxID=1736538 RepID=UPI000708BB16|nr:sugar ABC transporter permease [Paenibacillus sp. Root444D2]KQX44662.1 ABC transporter permease [Paenibacillus sp. Root444D2]
MNSTSTSIASVPKIRVRKKQYNRQNGVALLFLAPWFIGLLFMTIGPMLASLYFSFTDYSILAAPTWVGTSNYTTLFTEDPLFLTSLKVTFIYVFISVPLKLLFALAVAMLLNKGIRGLGIYRTIYYIPSLLGGSVAIAMLWRKMLGGDGLLNQLLLHLGIHAPDWVSNPKYALYSIILLSVWQFGSSMIIFLSGLKQIPAELYEASAVDGAKAVKQFFTITIPILTPVIFFNLVMQIITSFQSFTQAYVISNGTGGPIKSTLMYSLYLYKKGFSFFQMGYASAMAWVLLIIIAILTIFVFQSSKSWVHYEDGGK